MGGCATKPKVSKDDPDVKAKAPEPEPELLKEDAVDEITKVPQESAEPQHDNTVDEDQTNKRRSLSLWFDKENDDTKVSEENEKTAVEETVVKQESSKAEEKKLLDNEAAKQESPLIELEEKSAVQNESNKPAEEPAKLEKLIEENQRSEPLKQEYVEAKDTFSVETQNKEPPKQEYGDAKETFSVETQNKEPIKQEPLPAGSTIEQPEAVKPSGGPEKNGSKAEKSETLIEENTNTKVVPQTKEKIVEALLTDAGSVQKKNITEEATSIREEKNHNEVEHASKATDASSVKT